MVDSITTVSFLLASSCSCNRARTSTLASPGSMLFMIKLYTVFRAKFIGASITSDDCRFEERGLNSLEKVTGKIVNYTATCTFKLGSDWFYADQFILNFIDSIDLKNFKMQLELGKSFYTSR